jgi:hypothetical protein
MDMLPMALIISQDAGRRELLSALPDAPVVPHREPRRHRPQAVRSRAVLAQLLERTAHWIEPKPSCTPLH